MGILGHLTVWDDVAVMSLDCDMGTDKRRFGGPLYLGRENERTFQQKEIARAGTSRHSETLSGEMADGVHLTVHFLAGPNTLNASAYHFRVFSFATRVNRYSYSEASRFFFRVYPEIASKHTQRSSTPAIGSNRVS